MAKSNLEFKFDNSASIQTWEKTLASLNAFLESKPTSSDYLINLVNLGNAYAKIIALCDVTEASQLKLLEYAQKIDSKNVSMLKQASILVKEANSNYKNILAQQPILLKNYVKNPEKFQDDDVVVPELSPALQSKLDATEKTKFENARNTILELKKIATLKKQSATKMNSGVVDLAKEYQKVQNQLKAQAGIQPASSDQMASTFISNKTKTSQNEPSGGPKNNKPSV